MTDSGQRKGGTVSDVGSSAGGAISSDWNRVTKALVVGYAVLFVFLHAAFRSGIAGPVHATQLAMWVASLGVVSFLLLHYGLDVGYAVAVLTALLGASVGFVANSGILGPVPAGALSPSPVIGIGLGPVAFILYSIVLVWAAVKGRRATEKTTDDVETRSPNTTETS